MAGFTFSQKVLFKHCDPAGIVFYPRYFEMMNDCVEAFFDEVLEFPFESFHQIGGAPTAEISSKFMAPSRHGDQLVLTLVVEKIGRTSMHYLMTAKCGDEPRFETRARLVFVNDQGRPAPWPDAVLEKLSVQEDIPA